MMNEKTGGKVKDDSEEQREKENKEMERRMKRDREREGRSAGDARRGLADLAEKLLPSF